MPSSEAAPVQGAQRPGTALVPAQPTRPQQQTRLAPSGALGGSGRGSRAGAVVRQEEVRQVRSADGSRQAMVVRQQEV